MGRGPGELRRLGDVGRAQPVATTTTRLYTRTVVKDALVHPLPEPLVELIAQRFRVLSEPSRIRLIDILRDGPRSVQELTAASGSSQQNVSKHLGILHGAGILSREKRGTSVLYSIADESVLELCEHVCGGLRRQLDELGSVLAGA